jgi:asparagine synthase (glutamine-hydrolysing)
MCGIAGVTGPCDPKLLSVFQAALKHRGPDEQGTICSSMVGLCSTRLAIIDLATGKQPIWNEDQTCAIVFNGEIYNYRELRHDLERRHHFQTLTDTEVILHLYEEKGLDTSQFLRGDFAFCIWDARDGSCFLSRDPLGVKPLFYTITSTGNFAFSSEISALSAHPDVKGEIDLDSVAEYLTYMYVAAPRTLLRNVHKLEPGESLLWKNGSLKVWKYWQLPDVEEDTPSPLKIRDHILALLRTAVSRRLIADVPVGAFLSGGLDSSIIVALAREQSHQLHTFSIGYGERDYDELRYARIVSERFQTMHHEFVISMEAENLIESVIEATDEPIADSSAIPTFLVAREARKFVKVALSGIGGDELFFGYPRYLGAKLSELVPARLRQPVSILSSVWSSRPSGRDIGGWIRRFGRGVKLSMQDRYDLWTSFLDENGRSALLPGLFKSRLHGREASILFDRMNGAVLDRIFRIDMSRYLASDLLQLCDNMTMANSLEIRVPFCDSDLVSAMAKVPAATRFPGLRLKPLLKDVASEYLPPQILHRQKRGFMIPIGRWFRGQLRPYLEEQLGKRQLPEFVDSKATDRMLKEHASGKANHTHVLWALLLLTRWMKKSCAGVPSLR